MNKNSIYFHVTETENELIIDDRLEVSWKEIILYPFPFFSGTYFFKRILVCRSSTFSVDFIRVFVLSLFCLAILQRDKD